MKKFQKVAASALAVAMVGSMFAGCSSSDTAATTAAADATTAASSDETKAADDTATTAAVTEDQGKVLNIYCWNNEFATRMLLYPGYTANDTEDPLQGGKIGDVTVKFIQVANADNAYQNALDTALDGQADAADDDKVDMFLVEADYALKYVDTDYTLDVYSLGGLTKEDTANQYSYTQSIMTDSNGILKGVSWQGCPGLLFYNRDIASEVLGTDDPDEVQEYVSDWSKFTETAQKVKDAGYLMESSVNDSFRVYSNNVTSPWVVDGKITIDDNLKAWVDQSKEIYDMGATTNDDLWTGYANATNGGCFCVFGPAWLINFSLGYDSAAVADGSADMTNVCNAGKWGACVGPQSFYWGGTWMCAAAGTDNSALVADIMKQLTTNTEIMKSIVTTYDDFVNNQAAMEEMAADTTYSSYVLGGMNPLGLYDEGAKKISLDNITAYDQGCNEEFQSAMKAYFAGDSTYDECLSTFYTNVTTKYPALSY